MIIGLILSAAPGYSETFFRNKIRFLTDAGFKVIVFTNSAEQIETDFELIGGFAWNGGWFERIGKLFAAAARLLGAPKRSFSLFILNKKSGSSLRENVLSLLSVAHVLKFNLDWLHFGFATTALGKENLAQAMNAKMAVSIRGFDIAVYPLKHPGCYRKMWQTLDKLHYISDDLLKLAVENGFDPNKEHQKITPAIDTKLFSQKKNAVSEPIQILSVARLHWIKGLEYVLEALSFLNAKKIDFVYTIIGTGNDYERLVFAAYQLDLTEKVNFVGAKPASEVSEFYQNSDIYLQYSIHEGFCNAVLEAQSVGLLCVVSDGGALKENVVHNKTGWIVPKRNPQLLAEQIENVINLSAEEKKVISEAARKRVAAQFNLEQQRDSFESFYR